jgi:hypothetical protein
MDRRTFLKKAAQLFGTSATGISLTKLQIASIATGLAGTMGCSRNPIGANNLTNEEGNFLMAPCQITFNCNETSYSCEEANFTCVNEEFICKPDVTFICNPSIFTCSTRFKCLTVSFSCSQSFNITHQGSITVD